MHIIGILGGVASGKSVVARRLQELGAVWLDADAAGHAVLREEEVKTVLRIRFGDAIFDTAGEINRKALAKIVFAPGKEGIMGLADLEAITHPRIGQKLREQLEEIAKTAAPPAAILDAAVMIKAGWHSFCDKILFVDADDAARKARAIARGWTVEEWQAREAAQDPLPFKRGLADVVIENSGSLEATLAQVDRFWASLVADGDGEPGSEKFGGKF